MKNYSQIIQFISVNLLLLLLFSINIEAQQTKQGDELGRVRYISSNKPSKDTPKIKVVESGITRIPSNSIKAIKPDDLKLEKVAFDLINNKRKENGKKTLVWSNKIADLAREHSQNMAKFNFFSHIGLNGRTIDNRATDFGIDNWNAVGENIAYNRGFQFPAQFAVDRWMLSDTHRNNLLNENWKESGIGISITEDGIYFFTQIFMR